MFYILFILTFLFICFIFLDKIINRNIQAKNTMWLIKLKKDTLNNLSLEDLKDLLSIILKEIIKRKKRKWIKWN